jgi:hypothetical protein
MLGRLKRLVVRQLPSLGAAILGIPFAVWVLRQGWTAPLVMSAVVVVSMVVGYLRGTRRVRSDPTGAIKWLELAYPLLVVCGALVVGVLLWAGIEFAAPREATEERKQLGAAVLAAAGVVLSGVLTKPLENLDDPMSVIQGVYRRRLGRILSGRDPANPDPANIGYDALWEDTYSDGSQTVDGWGWSMRRTRARHLRQALSSLCARRLGQ